MSARHTCTSVCAACAADAGAVAGDPTSELRELIATGVRMLADLTGNGLDAQARALLLTAHGDAERSGLLDDMHTFSVSLCELYESALLALGAD